MEKKNFFNDLHTTINQVIEQSPIKDIEQNVRALITQALSRLDMVTREEFDLQAMSIAKMQEEIRVLEQRINILEQRLSGDNQSI